MAADPTTATLTAAPAPPAPPAGLSDARFRVMGSDAHLVIDGDPALLHAGRRRLEDLEARWSRFLPGSEVSRLNAAGGALSVVSPDTYRLVACAADAWIATGGRFDPTVLGDVIRAGYDTSFESLPESRDLAPLSGLHRGAAGIVLLPSATAVALPPGTGFDPGGIGKGLAADIVAGELMAAGAAGVCVNVGGDLRVAGTRAGESRWVIAVDPGDDGDLVAAVALGDGAVATTTRTRRAWTVAGSPSHHLIDPATGRPAEAGLATVTVVAAECWRAETIAKAAFVAGAGEALAVIERAGADGLVVGDDGAVTTTAGLDRYLTSSPPVLTGATPTSAAAPSNGERQ